MIMDKVKGRFLLGINFYQESTCYPNFYTPLQTLPLDNTQPGTKVRSLVSHGKSGYFGEGARDAAGRKDLAKRLELGTKRE